MADYFSPYNEALKTGMAVSSDNLAQAYKLHEFETAQKMNKLKYDAAKLQYDTLKRQNDLETKAREAASAAPDQVENPAYKQFQAATAGPPQMVPEMPAYNDYAGLDRTFKPVYPGQDVQPPPQFSPVNRIKVYLDTLAQSDPQAALEAKGKLYGEFMKSVPPGVNPNEAIAAFNQMFETSYTAAPSKKDLTVVPSGAVLVNSAGETVVDNPLPTFGEIEERRLPNGKTVAFVRDERGKPQVVGSDTAPRITVNAGSKVDDMVAREAVKDLPKLRREARSAEQVKPRIDQMLQLMEGSGGGLKGNVLASVSGIFDTPATSEAELFKKLAQAGAGQLRASVIGPGPVSNYEQGLLQAISGGGNGARTATRALLKYYKQEAQKVIDNYNDALDSASTVAPKAEQAFGRVGGVKPPKGVKTKSDPMGIL